MGGPPFSFQLASNAFSGRGARARAHARACVRLRHRRRRLAVRHPPRLSVGERCFCAAPDLFLAAAIAAVLGRRWHWAAAPFISPSLLARSAALVRFWGARYGTFRSFGSQGGVEVGSSSSRRLGPLPRCRGWRGSPRWERGGWRKRGGRGGKSTAPTCLLRPRGIVTFSGSPISDALVSLPSAAPIVPAFFFVSVYGGPQRRADDADAAGAAATCGPVLSAARPMGTNDGSAKAPTPQSATEPPGMFICAGLPFRRAFFFCRPFMGDLCIALPLLCLLARRCGGQCEGYGDADADCQSFIKSGGVRAPSGVVLGFFEDTASWLYSCMGNLWLSATLLPGRLYDGCSFDAVHVSVYLWVARCRLVLLVSC